MSLIQSNVKYYLEDILTKCHDQKTTIYYWSLNIGVLTIFIVVIFCILYYCYKQKPTEEELREKMIREQQYVLQQIRFYQGMTKTTSQITDLPTTNYII
jgi:hypothetical protein